MTLVIREAKIEDATLIANISHQTFYDTFSPYNSTQNMDKFLKQQFTKGKLILEVGAKQNIFLLAYDGDTVAGYVKIRDDRLPLSMGKVSALEIARLYAMTNQIGKGVGSKLMQSCLQIAKEKSKEWLWLGVWEKNKRAIDFYTKWGFEKFDETDFLLGDDMQRDWLMKKKV
ncbi:MAG: GNAT family N-acetyltransferase [Flavisolibacter sp.]